MITFAPCAPPYAPSRPERQISSRPHFIVGPEAVADTDKGAVVEISGSDAHHIRNVLRLKPGDRIDLSAGARGRFLCSVSEIGADSVSVEIIEMITLEKSNLPRISLCQAVLKGHKMDDAIRMACEMGVAEIHPMITRRCVVKQIDAEKRGKTERWRAIAHAVCKQSKSHTTTEIREVTGLADVVTLDAGLKIVFWEEETTHLKTVLNNHSSPGSILIVVGPEGGFGADEIDPAKSAGCETASLGSSILRAETAPVAAISAIKYHYS